MKYRAFSLAVALATLIFLTTLTPAYAQDSSGAVAQQAGAQGVHPDELAARSASGKPLADTDRLGLPPQINRQTAVACNTCFTCGGDWPIFAGATHAVNTGSLTFERGAGCSGALLSANDQNPFLCCR
jgi:hypothetical protein